MSSTFGHLFRATTFGESHGGGVGVVVDGCPPRLAISVEVIQADLDRRRPGQSRLVTQRQEADEVEILSGVFDGYTTGSPIGLLVRNTDARPQAYDHLRDLYRPSHADYTTGIEVLGWVSSVHDIDAEVDPVTVTAADVEAGPTRCPDPDAAARIEAAIEAARRDGDSLGGVVTCVARNVPPGLGDPVFDKLDATLGGAMLSLPAAKGVEIGSGFAGTRLTGRTHNDPFVPGPDGRPRTATNLSGGVQGGISNGEDVVVRVAFKPTATISSEQKTVTRDNEPTVLAAKGRHDPCVLPRAVPIVEAMMLLVLADHWLHQRAVDVLPPLDR